MNKGISVIVCCYNSEKRLPQTLHHILSQKVESGVRWEVIVVDNASSDNTTAKANEILSKSNVSHRVETENKPGLSYARARGFALSNYEYLLYCDDDNWLAADYVQKSFEAMELHPPVVILGGMGEAVFESAEPLWFKKYEHNFAVGDQSSAPNDFSYVEEVYGAGFTIRKSFLQQLDSLGFKSLLSDRSQKQLISGGDTELCYVAKLLGYKIGYNRTLKFKHLMTAPRLKWDYLKKLYFGFGRTNIYSQAYTQAIKGNDPTKLNLRFPLWLDTWMHKAKDAARFYPKVMFKSGDEGNEDVLKFIAMKGELSELWNLKEKYSHLYNSINGYLALFKKARV